MPAPKRPPHIPDESVSISAVTWNMGNQAASRAAVNDVMSMIQGDTEVTQLPTVIALATQEELAATGKRLQDLLLEELNKDKLPGSDGSYVLVETDDPQYHKTMAGANNSPRTLRKALTTDNNRVSNAILVKLPYELEGARARIDYEPNKTKGNKSIITIEGILKKRRDETPEILDDVMNICISGLHLDSNHDAKRRAHAQSFFDAQGLTQFSSQSYDDILSEAQKFKVIMGDFNERDYLMKDGSTRDQCAHTSFAGHGYDMSEVPMHTMTSDSGERREIHGTYGFSFDESGRPTVLPDPRSRTHVAKGGALDRVAYTSGLEVQSASYGATLSDQYLEQSKKGKWFFHDSDHLPVARNFTVTPPDNTNESQIICEFVQRKIPTSGHIPSIKSLQSLAGNLHNSENRYPLIRAVQYHDSSLTEDEFLECFCEGADKGYEQQVYLNSQILRYEEMDRCMSALHSKLDVLSQERRPLTDFEKKQVVDINNLLDKYHRLKDSVLMHGNLIDNEAERIKYIQENSKKTESIFISQVEILLAAKPNDSLDSAPLPKPTQRTQTWVSASSPSVRTKDRSRSEHDSAPQASSEHKWVPVRLHSAMQKQKRAASEPITPESTSIAPSTPPPTPTRQAWTPGHIKRRKTDKTLAASSKEQDARTSIAEKADENKENRKPSFNRKT